VTVVACGVPVWGCGGEGYFGSFYERVRHHLLAYKGYPCVKKDHVKAEVNKHGCKQFFVILNEWLGSSVG
jgi:hypothetical protein